MVTMLWGMLGLFIAGVGIIVGNASGAGAGGFVVPCFFLCFGYNISQSVALWNAVILVVSVWRIVNSIVTKEKHPEGNKSIIDFDSVLIFQPSLYIGIECGFITMAVLPEGMKLIGFCLMLTGLTMYTFKKAYFRQKLESAKNSLLASNNKMTTTSLQVEVNDEEIIPEEIVNELFFPVKKIVLNVVAFTLLTITHLLLGSSKTPSLIGIHSCSRQYWIGLGIYFALLILLLWYSYQVVQGGRNSLLQKGIKPLPSEFEWTSELIINASLLAILAGFFSSSYGVGGGIILNMILIYKGVNPEVVTSTTMLSIACICLSTTTVYTINHTLPLDGYAIALIILGLPLTIISYASLKKTLQKHSSLILFTLAYALGVSAVLVVVFGFYKAYYIDHNPILWDFGTICHT